MSARKSGLPLYTDPLISAANMASSHTGTPVSIQFQDNIGYQFKWSGANPIGTIKLQVSLDYDPNAPSAATWTTLQNPDGSDFTITPGGAAGSGYADLNQLSANYIRPVYTTAGGSVGSLTAKVAAKMI